MKVFPFFLIIFLLLTEIHPQNIFPEIYELEPKHRMAKSLTGGLQSNGISEIILQGESRVWLGTGRGISYMEDSLTIYTLDTLTMKNESIQLMYDGISGIAAHGEYLVFAGASGDELGDFGTGIFYNDGTNEWVYHTQPIEDSQDASILQPIGTGFFEMLPITTHYNNITYDLAVTSNYAWITSWAGGLRRIPLDSLSSENATWSPVPLPEDHQLDLLTCDETIFDDSLNVIAGFFLNPRDPGNGGNHNHKAFSVI